MTKPVTATSPGEEPAGRSTGAADLARLAGTLGEMLALGRPLPLAVAQRAAVDPLFLARLVGERENREAIGQMIDSASGHLPKWAPPPTPVLVGKAVRALGRWAASGFSVVPEETARRRRQACLECEHLQAPGQHLLFALTGAGKSTVCGLCSCAIDRKVTLPTESCPAGSLSQPGFSRWGEPLE